MNSKTFGRQRRTLYHKIEMYGLKGYVDNLRIKRSSGSPPVQR